jgi:tellurite methyltransferase
VSDEDRARWNARYEQGAFQDRTYPGVFLAEHIDRLPRGRALDLACGAGRNAIFLAQHGFEVDAWDISAVGLDRARARAAALGLDIAWQEKDLEEVELPVACYDVIVQNRYVNWPLTAQAVAALKPGGAFLCEQHLATERDVIGPSDPAFRAQPGQLRDAVAALEIEIYEESHIEDPDGRVVAVARVLARRADA